MKRSHPNYGSRKSNLIWHTFAMIIIPDRPCFATPCYNGGTCTENAANYTCTCISGYDPASDCRLGETDQYIKPIEKIKKCDRLGETLYLFILSDFSNWLLSEQSMPAYQSLLNACGRIHVCVHGGIYRNRLHFRYEKFIVALQ